MNIKHEIEQVYNSQYNHILQYPSELEQFIQFMIDNKVRRYLEVGCKNGHLVRFLHQVLQFDKVFACDRRDHADIRSFDDLSGFYLGDCHSDEYMQWRKKIGHIDLVLLDAAHNSKLVRREFKNEKSCAPRFIAIHDIANKRYPDMRDFWKRKVKGRKNKFINRDIEAKLISLDSESDKAIRKYRRRYGTSCGIGVVEIKR